MTNDVPGSGTPDPGKPPEAGAPAGGWPQELVPPPAAPDQLPPAPAPAAPTPAEDAPGEPAPEEPVATEPAPSGPPTSGTWGTTPSSGTWGTPPPGTAAAPTPPDASPTQVWGQPATPGPAAPEPEPSTSWGATPGAAPAPVSQQPQTWGAATPPLAGGWGAQPPASGQPPAGQPPAQPGQPGQWGAPPPGGGYPGGPPPGGWAPPPATSNNGCLKACLIVGGILVVLGILGAIGLTLFASRFAEDIGVNPDGSLKGCGLISREELAAVVGEDAEALPMGGIVDNTIGRLLDQRILKEAPDCWIVASGAGNSGTTGRLALQDGGDTSGDFARYRQAAQDGGYYAADAPGFGDEAFCTSATQAASFGILVRSGGRLAYVSLINPTGMQNGDVEVGPNGEMVSPSTCAKAGEIARAMLN